MKFRQFFNRKTENFVVIIQYKQIKNIVVRGQVSITTYRTTLQGEAEFKYCPNTEFCRVVVKPTDTSQSDFRIRQGTTSVEVRFPVKLDVQVVSIKTLIHIRTLSCVDNNLNDNEWLAVQQNRNDLLTLS